MHKYLFFSFLVLCGCRQDYQNNTVSLPKEDTVAQNVTVSVVEPDTSNQYIYDFIRELTHVKLLDMYHGLSPDPEPNATEEWQDSAYLRTMLIGQSKNGTPFFERKSMTFNTWQLPKCLTKKDVRFMLAQKAKLSKFRWNGFRAGFDTANRGKWYSLSIPLFSRDSSKVLMMVEDLCPGLCGSGSTVLFMRENGKWTSYGGRWWIH